MYGQKKSETLINKNLKSRKAEFLKGIKYGIIQLKKKPKNILFVASPYKTIIKSNKIKIFNNILKTLKLNSSPGRLVYCAHPEDYRNNVLKRLLIKNQIIYSKIQLTMRHLMQELFWEVIQVFYLNQKHVEFQLFK